MIDEYKLVNSDTRGQQHVVSPHGEKLAVVVRTSSGISVALLNTELPSELKNRKYKTLEDLRSAIAGAHYKLLTSGPQRVWKKIAVASDNPVWAWGYGLIATVLAIWGWID